jgi:ribosomal protein S18 acetylase RimI-like enzyme
LRDDLVIEPLSARHDRSGFSCGVDALDRYLREQAAQDARRRIANCFVAVAGNSGRIAGYYTFSATNIPAVALPDDERRRLPLYDAFPAALIGRLAVDKEFRRRGLGSALIIDAGERAMRSEPAIYALVVQAKDADAAAFYKANEFRAFVAAPLTLFLPIATIRRLSQS